MAINVNTSGMNSDNNSYENGKSSHVHDVFMDKQLQNKLLQADEDLDIEAYESKLTKPGNNLKNSATKAVKNDSHVEDITGWFPNAKFVARQNLGAKTDNQTAKSTKDTFIHPWKDYRAKKEESFVFKHYNEPKKYIEQYRKEHGCHITRFSSGNQIGEMRRVAFQTTAPQSQAQNAVQVSLQQIQQVTSNGSNYQPGLHYTNRKEQLGTLQVNQGPSSVCTCKTSHADPANNNHRYKLAQPVGHMSRTNTDIRSYPSELSDNSSDTGDHIRSNSPVRRINSATSSRSNSRHSKSPTKISVPANPRAYPLHALTIQQNGKTEVQPQAKPLDNLNCVAPEKQPVTVEKKPVEPLGVALRVQSLHDLLTNNETPLRGSALPKSMPPNPVSNNHEPEWPASSDSDTNIETRTPDVSIDQLSTCALHANKGSVGTQKSAEILQMFLQDPVLSRLNQKPQIKEPTPESKPVITLGTPKLFSPDAFLIPQNDVDAMLKVNMWNPIVSQTPVSFKKDVNESGSQPYRTVMTQVPFRNPVHHGQEVKPMKVHHMDVIGSSTVPERHDFFNPMKNIKLSITRVNNGVSFCKTQFQDDQHAVRKGLNSRGTIIVSLNGKSATGDGAKKLSKDIKTEASDSRNSKSKPPVKEQGPASKKQKSILGKFDQKMNMPLPMVKIFESVPTSAFIPSPLLSKSASDMQIMDGRAKTSNEQFRPAYGSAKLSGRNSVQQDGTRGITTSAIVKKVMPFSAESRKHGSNQDIPQNNGNQEKKTEIKSTPLTENKDKSNEATKMESEQREVERLNGIVKMFQANNIAYGNNVKSKDEIKEEDNKKDEEKPTENLNIYKATKVSKKPAVASGKLLRQDPKLDGLTWAEKLEILRAVNKRPAKPKPRQPKLRYITDSPDDRLWSPEEEQIYEQRRIKHLLEQARVKGGKQYDWVHEAQMRSRGIDWGTGKLRLQSGDSIDSNSDLNEFQDSNEKFEKYGISAYSKLSPTSLFDLYNNGRRSKTFVLP